MEPNPDQPLPDGSDSDHPPRESQTNNPAQERDRRRRTEVVTTFVLALTTIASSWCAYQASLWNGEQTFYLVHSNFSSREGMELNVTAQQYRLVDASMLISFLEARGRGDEITENILRSRMRPPMRAATEAWLKTDPFNNPGAPAHPLMMKEYLQPEDERAKGMRDKADDWLLRAQEANEASDRYVLLTVIFASVLFFGGIGGTFSAAGARTAMFYIMLALFAFGVVRMSFLPVTGAG